MRSLGITIALAWNGAPFSNISEDMDQNAPGSPIVLVVEDEPLLREAVVEGLHDVGIAVIEAGDAPTALEVLATGEPIAAVVTDVKCLGIWTG